MEHKRFDDLTKTLASGVSRREMFRRLGVGITGAVLASLLPTHVLAEPKPKTIRCKVRENGHDADGNKISVYCEVECTGDAGYCISCGAKNKDKDGDSLACAAACCANDDLNTCTPPNKKEAKAQCQQGVVKIVKEKG